MHVYFSGIGGAGMCPLALLAKDAGFTVSGSDKRASEYLDFLKKHGISDVHVGQSRQAIAKVNESSPIDWFVYTTAVTLENPDHAELAYCREQAIKVTKRDQLINFIIEQKHLDLIAVSGTHGKTTTTAMLVWLLHELGEPLSYLLPAKTSFAKMGQYQASSRHFIYEADEFDRNFLAYRPALSLVTGVSWDHHEIFPTRQDYKAAFKEFIGQSKHTLIWREDADYLELVPDRATTLLNSSDKRLEDIKLFGKYNRLDAYLAVCAVERLTNQPIERLIDIVNRFPGLSRRMEQIAPNLYSDYAHTPEKIRGAMSVALEMASQEGQALVVVYEPLTNRRQHYLAENYRDCFSGAKQLYWLPSYLAREPKDQRIIPPEELISHLDDPSIAQAAERNEQLKKAIKDHLANGDVVVGMAGGGGGSLDDWLRDEFKT